MKNILIIDDSATSRMLFKAHLPKGHSFAVQEAKDMDSALAAIASTRPDLVVLDYNMPDHNGVEVAQRLLATGLDVKLALLTANTQQAVVAEARACGFGWIIEKPITSKGLAHLIEEASR